MAEYFMRFPGGVSKALTLSYDDGVEQDIRLIEIMQKHGIKGTFNLNSGFYSPEGTVFPEGQIHRRLSKSQAQAVYKNSGMEVAVHGLTHPFWNSCLPTYVPMRYCRTGSICKQILAVLSAAWPIHLAPTTMPW